MVLTPIKALFLDVGGVLLTNGWDHHMRQKAAEFFHLNYDEMNQRHALTFDTYEIGKLSLDDYLSRTIFYQPRPFSKEDFKTFMFSQSQPDLEMISLISHLKIRYGFKIVVVSNEGRELTNYRVHTFKLKEFVDIFIFSCFVHLRKPDEEIYRLALEIAQVEPPDVAYIEDRLMLVEIANQMGMRGIHHNNVVSTQKALALLLKEKENISNE